MRSRAEKVILAVVSGIRESEFAFFVLFGFKHHGAPSLHLE